MGSEIKVKVAELQLAQQKMLNLERGIRSIDTNLTFSESKGNTVVKLGELVTKLALLQQNLADLYGNTASAVGTMLEMFQEADGDLSGKYNTMAYYEVFDVLGRSSSGKKEE